MSREQSLHGIILKKQTFAEADELITLYTEEFGKVRLKARGVKKPASKLQYSLQVLNQVEVAFVHGGISTIIQAQTEYAFPRIREFEDRVVLFFWMAELIIKSTPDEAPNPRLYSLLQDALHYLNNADSVVAYEIFLSKFILVFLEIMGFALLLPLNEELQSQLFFSNSAGGFTGNPPSDGVVMPDIVLVNSRFLLESSFDALPKSLEGEKILLGILSGFVTYQIERKINAEHFLKVV